MLMLVASCTVLTVRRAVGLTNSPLSSMAIPLRNNSRRFRLMVKLPIFSCMNAAMNNAATKSSRLSSSTCSLSMRSNAVPNSRRRRRGIYMLTSSSSSAGTLPEASSRCNSSMRKTCFLPGLRRNRCPLFSRSSFRRAFSSASSAACRIASRSSSGGAEGCFGLRLSICPPHYSLYRRLMFAQ